METIKKPEFPIGYVLYEGDCSNLCDKCGSSLVRTHPRLAAWTFGLIDLRGDKCIHPECENSYYKYKGMTWNIYAHIVKAKKSNRLMKLVSHKKAIATKFDWNGCGGPTVWLSVNGIEDNRIPVVVTEEQMHAIVAGSRKVNINITITTDGDET